jgi:hypothetical protein
MDASLNTSDRRSDRGSNVRGIDGPTATTTAATATAALASAARPASAPSGILRTEKVRRPGALTRNKGRLADAMIRNTRHGPIRLSVAEYR